MTKKIAQSRDEAANSQQRAERQKAYLEAVLGRLSSGVLVLDKKQIIRTANKAASQIFGFALNEGLGKSIHEISEDNRLFNHFVDVILPHLQEDLSEWRDEITFFGASGRQVLMCRGASLLGEGDLAGYVIVFDDITALIQVQHDAAWGEVARRLAHEIKNPLTPIQLSAERLRHKYLTTMPPADAELLNRATNTIVQQVETMKEMVKAFSDYARSPKLKLQTLDLNALIEEVWDLYREDGGRIAFHLHLQRKMPLINADVGRMRQLLNNLIKNAIEAIPNGQKGEIGITTQVEHERDCQMLELRVEDNGPGFPNELVGRIFEPYVTSKPKGSGLGLAIVKKIVEEHSGVIFAENRREGGACVVIRLPVAF
jgi:PAS domain S-box-containing protein